MLPARTLRSVTPALRRLPQRRTATSNVQGGARTQDNEFTRERQNVKAHAAATSDLWRKLSIYVVIPALCIASVNAWRLWNEHWEHKSHEPPVEERVEYPYMNIRNKKFPWGDGDKTLFWNPKVNHHKTDE